MHRFTIADARRLAEQLGIDFSATDFTAEEFLDGLHVELEHGLADPNTDVTGDDPLTTAKIVLAHLNENGRYYDKNIGVEAWEHALDAFKGSTAGKRIRIE